MWHSMINYAHMHFLHNAALEILVYNSITGLPVLDEEEKVVRTNTNLPAFLKKLASHSVLLICLSLAHAYLGFGNSTLSRFTSH